MLVVSARCAKAFRAPTGTSDQGGYGSDVGSRPGETWHALPVRKVALSALSSSGARMTVVAHSSRAAPALLPSQAASQAVTV